MRITFFIGSMVSGGAERVISILANQYVDLGWDVDIALLLKNEVNRIQFPLSKKIRIVDLTFEGTSYGKKAFRWIRMVRKHLKKNKPDCIVSFIGRINVIVLLASIGLHIPVLISERNDPHHDGRGKMLLTISNVIYLLADAIVFQTEYEKSCFSKVLNKKSYIIPNPVDVIYYEEVTENLLEVSTAGRLTLQKNHSVLIDAISMVKEKIPTIKCEIYGDGVLRNELTNQIKEKKLEENVHLCGNKTDISKWILKSSIFVISSDFEGLSNALIEAMMLGRACITTDYPGARELIRDGINGIVVPCNNPPELAKKILLLLSNKEMRECFAKKAKEDSKQFDKNVVLEKWNKVIDRIVFGE